LAAPFFGAPTGTHSSPPSFASCAEVFQKERIFQNALTSFLSYQDQRVNETLKSVGRCLLKRQCVALHPRVTFLSECEKASVPAKKETRADAR
jgi:hypothetical protein